MRNRYYLGKLLFTILLSASFTWVSAQEEKEKENENEKQVQLGMQLMGHGETRNGGLGDASTEGDADNASFLMSRTRLSADYLQKGLEARVTAQHVGVWGQKGQGSLNLYEAWAKVSSKSGLFAQLGRVALSYDDERIIGPNDWAMASKSHDVLRAGYEGHGHKAHLILAYNQNAENTYGGTYYVDGAQTYKTMHTLWYHYDVPKAPLGASLLFMNVGMQGGDLGGEGFYAPNTQFQQLLGGYVNFHPKDLTVEASYYRQFGKDEDRAKIDAWMTSLKVKYAFSPKVTAYAGFDYLSGDKYFAVPHGGHIGVVHHDKIRGFNPIYGSHHKFYGLMDFFYVSTYVNGFSPGLQNLYAGTTLTPTSKLRLCLSYHYMAMATELQDMKQTLGHDFDIEASYKLTKEVSISAGFSYMSGTETMERLKRASDDNSLRWGWVSVVVTPSKCILKW